MRTSGPGRRARQRGARNAFAFWPSDSSFTVIGGCAVDARPSGEDTSSWQTGPGWIDEPLLTIVRPAKDSSRKA